MQRRLPLFILGIILLAGLLFILPDGNPSASSQEDAPAKTSEAAASLVEKESAEPIQRVEAEVKPQVALDGEASAEKPEEITIEVWDRQGKRAVPFAQIYLEKENDAPRRYGNSNGFKSDLVQNGEVFRCDEQGRLQAPRSWLYRWVGAEGEGLWGTSRLSESKHRSFVRIDVQVDRNLTVKIVDPNGVPQEGVSAHLAGSRFGRLGTLLSAKSDSHGIATLLQVGDPYLAESGKEGVAVLVGDPPSPPAPALLNWSDLPDYTEISLGPTSSLELNLVDLEGKPILRDVPIKMNLLQPGESPEKHSIYTVYTTNVVSKNGGCVLPRIPVGHPLQLQVDFAGIGDVELIPVTPLEAGESRILKLQQSQEHPRMSFRVVDDNGHPLAHQAINYAVQGDISRQGNRPMQSKETTTDSEGRVFFSLAQPNMEWQGSHIFTRQLLVTETATESEHPRSGHLDLSRDFAMGEYDLSDVIVLPPTRIAFGKVVDTRGAPLADVRVDLQFHGSHSTGQGNAESYSIQFGKTVTTESNGRFEIWGEMPTEGSKLRFLKSGSPGDRVEWKGPNLEHSIVLDLGLRSIIAGQVLLPRGLEEHGISLSYYPGIQAEADPYKRKRVTSREEGYFRMTGMPEGPGFLEVGVGSGWPFLILHVVEDIQPWQRGEAGDPRLNPLDLRDSLHVFEVEMRNSDGDLIPNINFVSVFRRPGGSSSRGNSSAGGTGTFLSAESTFELIAEASGYRTAKVTLSEEHTVVTMWPALEIKIDLGFMPELKRQQSVKLALDPIDGSDSTGLLEQELFSKDGSLRTLISKPGVYEVGLGIFENGGSRWTDLLDASGEPVRMEVLESGQVQKFHLTPPMDFFDDLLRE